MSALRAERCASGSGLQIGGTGACNNGLNLHPRYGRRPDKRVWVAVKLKWGLTADRQELVALRKLLGNQVELPREAPEMNCTAIGQSSQLTLPSAGFKVVCGSKRYCRQMNSCEEAKAFLNQCGLSRLDSDKDGVPCEVLCN